MNSCFIILAGGESKRFNSKVPKPYHLYKGKPLLLHSIDKAKKYRKFSKIVVVINKKHKAHIKKLKIKNVKIIRSRIVGENHINSIIKPNIGPSIKAICFNCANSEIGDYLLSYKKKINVIAKITKNSWNSKNIVQLNIIDLLLPTNTA